MGNLINQLKSHNNNESTKLREQVDNFSTLYE